VNESDGQARQGSLLNVKAQPPLTVESDKDLLPPRGERRLPSVETPLPAEPSNAQPTAVASSARVAATPTKVAVTTPKTTDGSLDNFVASVKNGQRGVVVGLYVLNDWSVKVDQQPPVDPTYISPARGYATQFNLAAQYGSIGLLAHNHLAGAKFATLPVGRELDVVYGDGRVARYAVSNVRHFQALNPTDPASGMIDLDRNRTYLTSTEAFYQIYAQSERVVLQTCISTNGNPFWGRLFVIATPLK
jgi:hypothetical protein